MGGIRSRGGRFVDPRLQRLDEDRGERRDSEVLAATSLGAPSPDPGWHPVALRLYHSALESDYAHLFEPSDWSVAVILAESVDRELTVGHTPRVGSMTAWTQVLADLDARVARRHSA